MEGQQGSGLGRGSRPFSRAVPILLAAISGCGDAAQDRADASDTEAALAVEWAVEEEPSLIIGHEGSPEYEFTDVVGMGRLSSGDWMVFDRGSRQLRHYDSTGVFLRAAGGAGEGPGEFQDVLFMSVLDGSRVFAYDQILRRLTQWDHAGNLTGSWTLAPPATGTVPAAVGLTDGATFVWANHSSRPCVLNAVGVDSLAFYRLRIEGGGSKRDPTGTAEAPIAYAAGWTRWGSDSNILGTCLRQVVHFSPGSLAATRSGRLYIAERSGVKLTVHDLESGSSDVVHVPVSRRPLTREIIDRFIEREAGASHRDELRRELPQDRGMQFYATSLRELPYADSLPVVDQLRVDAGGYVWLRRYVLPTDPTASWIVVEEDGNVAAELALPTHLRVFDIGSDYIAGVERDSFDVQRIVIRRLRR